MTARARPEPDADARRRELLAAVAEEARRDAARILDRLWSRGDPDAPLPVDAVAIAHRLGIHTEFEALGDDDVVALSKEPDDDPVIRLWVGDYPNRRRVACAHALGHFVHPRRDPYAYDIVDRRGSVAAPSTDPEEVYANEFAAHLVIPPRELRQLRRGMTEVELAWRFDVTREAMRYRLLGLSAEDG